MFYLIKMSVPKKTYLLSRFSSRLYRVIMKLKCKASRYLSLFSCNSESHMTNYLNFKLSTDVEKNPGPPQNNTDSHETRKACYAKRQLNNAVGFSYDFDAL